MSALHVLIDNNGQDWLTPVATVVAVVVSSFLSWVVQSRIDARRWKNERAQALQDRVDAANAALVERDQARLAREQERVEARQDRDRERARARAEREDEHDREQAEQKRLRHAEERAAALVLQGDFATVASRLERMTVDQFWYGFMTFTIAHWDQLQLTIARADRLAADDWEAISQAALLLEAYEEGIRRATGPDGPQAGVTTLPMASADAQRGIHDMWTAATAAYNRLTRLTGTARVEGLLHEGATPQAHGA